MSLEQLQQVYERMAGGDGPDLTAPLAEVREGFERMMAAMPVGPDLSFQPAEAAGVPALWSRDPDLEGDRVLLYLHGGGYQVGSARGYRSLWSALARQAGARGFAVDYRLAPEHPFPAAVEDAVAAYGWLLDQGVAPASIVLAGDSAGGGLTVAALVEARNRGLPMPAAAAALSPWADLELSGGSMTSKAEEDQVIEKPGLAAMAGGYLGGAPARSPLASPIHADLTGLPPLLIHVGSSEILLDDAVRLAERAGAAGVKVRLEIWPHMPHVWHLFQAMLDEGREAVEAMGRFLGDEMAKAEELSRT